MKIVPNPQQAERTGDDFTVALACTYAPSFPRVAESLLSLRGDIPGLSLMPGDFIQMRLGSGLVGEAYELALSSAGISARAGTEQGLFYAVQTLKQLFVAGADARGITLPCCVIRDRPRFAHRSFMLDCARHFFDLDEIKRLLDLCALQKLNVFHWHLADDQGWRFESRKFPKLTELSSYRSGTKGDGVPVSGFYTQADMAEIVRYAADRFITVIPEIDVPGHVIALLHAYPEYSCSGKPVEVAQRFGILRALLCAGKEPVYDFLFSLYEEVAEIFPAPYIHIGGDEAVKTAWKSCPDCQRKIAELGWDGEKGLQAYMTARIAAHLRSLGKRAIVWNDTPHIETLDGSVTVQYWMQLVRLPGGPKRDIIMSRTKPYYLDYPYGLNTLRKIYNYEPLAGVAPEMQPDVIGLESPLWAEFVADRERLETLVFPRLCATAESAWSRPEDKDYADFRRRLEALLTIFERRGVSYQPLHRADPHPVSGFFSSLRFRLRQWGL